MPPDLCPRIWVVLALGAAIGGLMSPARAQVFTGVEPNPGVAMPGTVPAAPPGMPAKPLLRYLPTKPEGLRITGEIGDLRWPITITADQARLATRFRVGYLSSISVLPDASSFEIAINDTRIGTEVIDASAGPRTTEFIIPAGLLAPGTNVVSLTLQQRHRVDCSVPATYELWTKIDPVETGLVLPSEAGGVKEVNDLAAVLPKADGSMPIHVLLSGRTNPTHLQRLVKATQTIALTAHALQPAVDFAFAADDPYGLNLALGTRAALARLPQLADLLGSSGPLLRIGTGAPNGRPTLIITGSTDEEVDQAIVALGETASPRGTPAGFAAAALYPAARMSGGESLRLRDLGIRSEDFGGRFFRKSVELRLPADFLPSDYGRGTFDLAGGYAAGLERDAQVRVDINGRSAGTIKLPLAAGAVFQHNQLFLPLSLMRPGINKIDIIAETPRREDAACASSDGRRFLLLDKTMLTFPALAHIERLPDLSLMMAGAAPYLRGNAHLVVPRPDRDTMSAALSLAARAAVTAGRLVPFRFSTSLSTEDDGSTLVVSPARALDPGLMTAVGLDPAAVESAWRGVAASAEDPGHDQAISARWWTSGTDGPAACRLPTQAPAVVPTTGSAAVPPPAPAAAPERSDDLLDAWTGEAANAPGWGDRLMTSADHVARFIKSLVPALHMPFSAGGGKRDVLTADASLILAQGMSPGSRHNVTTIVTAPDATMLRQAMTCLFDPQVWPKVQGRLATLDASGGEVVTTSATSFHYVSSGQASLANARLVVAAWFSLNPFAFAAAAFAIALWLSGTTLWFVRNIGRRSE